MRQKYFVKLEYPSSVRIDSIETSCCGRSIYNDGWSINCGSIGFQGQSTLMCGSEPLSWLVKSFWQKCEYQTSRRNIMKHGQELGYKTTLWGERGSLLEGFWSEIPFGLLIQRHQRDAIIVTIISLHLCNINLLLFAICVEFRCKLEE